MALIITGEALLKAVDDQPTSPIWNERKAFVHAMRNAQANSPTPETVSGGNTGEKNDG